MSGDFYAQCWVSDEYARDDKGYMMVYVKDGRRRRTRAHRAVFIEYNGYAPPVVRHKCDRPECYNPTHLLPGTQADNIKDMHDRGRNRGRGPAPLNLDMPDQYTDRNAYMREQRRRKRNGTWNYRR